MTSDEYVHGAGRLLPLACALSHGQWTGEEEDGIWRARDGSDSGLAAPNQPLALSRGGEQFWRRGEEEGKGEEKRAGQKKEGVPTANTSSPCVHLEAVSRSTVTQRFNSLFFFIFSIVF